MDTSLAASQGHGNADPASVFSLDEAASRSAVVNEAEASSFIDPRSSFTVSVVIPARDESGSIERVLAGIRAQLPDAELLVVDDGSSDDTGARARAAGARVVRHPQSKGVGAGVKTGFRHASGDVVLVMDADGQMDPAYIPAMLAKIAEGYDMVVGARTAETIGDTALRRAGNAALVALGSYLVETPVHDVTSGYRAVRRSVMQEFLHLVPNRYGYPITITLALVRAGYSVGFVPVVSRRRESGKSRQKLFRNGVRMGLIVLRMISLFAPLRVYFPVALGMQLLALISFLYSFLVTYPLRLYVPNSAVALFVGGIIVFMFGLNAEQVAALRFQPAERSDGRDVGEPGSPT
jgi:glycosyltransferase involved in cell wall biosynthesis